MNVYVLGPLQATWNGASSAPSAAKPRSLLALLASYSGHVVPVDVIVSELWASSPPPSAATTIQTYVLQLRRLVRGLCRAGADGRLPEVKDILRTEPGGYVLDQAGGVFDAAEHERLATAGYEALLDRNFRVARSRLNEALALWRGPAFVDVQLGPRLSAHATLLEESRRTVQERRIEADLCLGRHHEILGELAGLTAEHPTDERLHAHSMVALYRSGRRSYALAVYDRLRVCLADELGLDPSPWLQRLRQAILLADPGLDHCENPATCLAMDAAQVGRHGSAGQLRTAGGGHPVTTGGGAALAPGPAAAAHGPVPGPGGSAGRGHAHGGAHVPGTRVGARSLPAAHARQVGTVP